MSSNNDSSVLSEDGDSNSAHSDGNPSSSHPDDENIDSDQSDDLNSAHSDEDLNSDLSGDDSNSGPSNKVTNGSKEEDIEQQVEVPKDIELSSLIVGLECHPQKNQIAIGTIDGPILVYSFGTERGNIEAIAFEHFKKPCRAVKFSDSGQYLFAGSQDTTIEVIDLETSSVHRKFSRTDGSSIYSLLPIDDYILASGEEDGQVVIWDFRMQAPIACFEECNEYISSLSMSKEKRILFATSGDGSFSVYNVRSKKMVILTEFDNELLCSAVIKNNTKVIAGLGDGSINIFNWGEYGEISDRFPGHPGSIDCMVKIAEDVICTGCEDGKVRAVQLFPTRFLGVVGTHNGLSVDGLAVSFDKTLLASSSFDQVVKFWDLSAVDDAKYADVKDTKNKNYQLNTKVDNFFADLEEDDDDDD